MSNMIICSKGEKEILYFVKDCIKIKNNFIGSNMKLNGIKLDYFDIYWTNDIVNEVFEDGEFVGYDKNIDQINISSNIDNSNRLLDSNLNLENSNIDQIEINKPNQIEYIEALKIRNNMSNFDYQQIDQYIDNNVSDINSAKEILKMFGKVILSLCRQIDYNI